jgi:hypothetical protein
VTAASVTAPDHFRHEIARSNFLRKTRDGIPYGVKGRGSRLNRLWLIGSRLPTRPKYTHCHRKAETLAAVRAEANV